MANKKINQLVSKTSILSTDLFGIGDATTGQLFKKTIAELQAAIGGAVISVNGLVGTVVLDTDDIQELATPTNKYFTDARARGAISLTVTGNSGASTYSSGTGVLNVPTYTLAGLGGITASFLSGTSGISYNSTTGVISYSGTVYTDSSIRALLSGGTGISYNSTTGAISYSGTVYTDSSVRALISLTTTGTSGASTYNNTTGVINVPEYTLAGLGGISLTSLSGGTGITYNNTTGAISYSGTVYTDASVRALISASGAVSYNNTTGVISLTGGNLTEATSSVLTITGGSGAVIGGGTSIQVKQATTSVSGFLSSTDWNTFNNKQGTITLTTTGTSGAATFSSGTLNIPQYAAALSGTTNYVAKFTSSTGIGNSLLFSDSVGVGINIINPNYSLQVNSSTTSNRIQLTNTSSGTAGADGLQIGQSGLDAYISNREAGAFDIETSGVSRLSIASTGAATFSTSVNITNNGNPLFLNNSTNTTSIGMKFTNGGGNYFIGVSNSGGTGYLSGSAYAFNIQSEGAQALQFGTNNANRLTISSTGASTFSSSVGTTALNMNNMASLGSVGGGAIYLPYNAVVMFRSTDGATAKGNIRGDNSSNLLLNSDNAANILMGTTTDNGERLYVSGAIRATSTITANSDLTLKKNLLRIENALEKVEQINGYTYEFKEDDSKRHAGVIAQEIQTVLPEIVNKGNDGILGVEYGNISALLIEAIKEQNIKIKNLETLLASK